MHFRKLSNKDWKVIEERIEKKLSSWKGKHLSVGGSVMINYVLSSLAIFMISFFEIPKGVLQKIDYYRSRFFWQGNDHKKKYRLTRWDIICQPKDQGGLGIHNLELQNKCLLSKWLYKLINEEGVWQNLLKRKYLYNKSITQVDKKQGDSHFWSGLMKVKSTFLDMGSWILNDGEQIRFWEDKWLGNLAFKDKFPSLYAIVRRKSSTIATVMGSVPLNVSFRRALVGQNLVYWHELCASIVHIQLNPSSDCFRWNYHQNGRFSVRSMYLALINNGYVERNKYIWKLKMPLKIKIFMWYFLKGVVLTKDNLARRN
jgi:hypothetical protein